MPKCETPQNWIRHGVVIARNAEGPGSEVVGDPCIVWDDSIKEWRMFLFYAPPGHGQAISINSKVGCVGSWTKPEPLIFTNPDCILGGMTHKPYVVMDPFQPNRAAYVEGRYYLLTVSVPEGHKAVQRATSSSLAGPWTLDPHPCIPTGVNGAFDEKHVDAVSGYYFPEQEAFLYYYMGYPKCAQARTVSPYGSAQAVAMQRMGDIQATKLGIVLPPCQQPGHWASGWVGGLQLLPGRSHRWVAILNASPTAPDPADNHVSREEPPPSLGGFAYCDEEWPIQGWHWCENPVEWIDKMPEEAIASGEGVNFWRHHLLALPGGRLALFYNSGYYGQEQMFMKLNGESCE